MSNMQTAGKKNRSTMDNIITINAVIEKQRQSQTNTFFCWCRKMLWQIMTERLPNRNGRDRVQQKWHQNAIQNEQKIRNNSRHKSRPNLKDQYQGNPAVMETMFSWLIMVTHGYFMVMFLYSILMVKNITIVQQKHG